MAAGRDVPTAPSTEQTNRNRHHGPRDGSAAPEPGRPLVNTNIQIACAWCGIAFVVLLTLGWIVIAGLVPLPSPSLGADEIAQFYQQNTGRIRFGALLSMFSMALTAPWIAVISVQLKRIEGDAPIMTYTQLVAGAATVVILTMPTIMWTLAAFRPERDPQLIYLVSDFSWLALIMTFPPFFIQLLAVGTAILSDRSATPVFPRWAGYFNVWVAILFIPGGLITFFKGGPFAWNGLLAFWMPLTVFFLWYLVMFRLLLAAIRQAPRTG